MDEIERCSCGKPLAECPEGLAYAITRRDDARAQLSRVQDECSKWRGQADHLREAMDETDRTLQQLAETAATLKRIMHGQRPTWVEWSALDDAWRFCQAHGISDPENPETR